MLLLHRSAGHFEAKASQSRPRVVWTGSERAVEKAVDQAKRSVEGFEAAGEPELCGQRAESVVARLANGSRMQSVTAAAEAALAAVQN